MRLAESRAETLIPLNTYALEPPNPANPAVVAGQVYLQFGRFCRLADDTLGGVAAHAACARPTAGRRTNPGTSGQGPARWQNRWVAFKTPSCASHTSCGCSLVRNRGDAPCGISTVGRHGDEGRGGSKGGGEGGGGKTRGTEGRVKRGDGEEGGARGQVSLMSGGRRRTGAGGFCGQCGTKFPAGIKFCGSCGTPTRENRAGLAAHLI